MGAVKAKTWWKCKNRKTKTAIFSTMICLYIVLIVVKVFCGLNLVIVKVWQTVIRHGNRRSTWPLPRYFPNRKRPTTTEALYSKQGSANPNLWSGVDEAPQGNTKSIWFDVNAKQVEKSERNHWTKPESTTVSSSKIVLSDDKHDTKTTPVTKLKHILKPPKFDRTTLLKALWTQYQNCVRPNRWERSTELVYLHNSLDKNVANIMWNYGKKVTESLSGLTKILKMRFGKKPLPTSIVLKYETDENRMVKPCKICI